MHPFNTHLILNSEPMGSARTGLWVKAGSSPLAKSTETTTIFTNNLPQIFWGSRPFHMQVFELKKSENLEKFQADTGRTCKLNTEEPETWNQTHNLALRLSSKEVEELRSIN